MAILRALYSLQLCSSNAPVGIAIPLAGRVHNRGRQWRRRRLAIPLSLLLEIGQVIAQRLFVETRLAAARLIAVGRPEARGVGRQDFVDDDQLALGSGAEFELGVGDDDAALRGVIATRLVQGETGAPQPLGRESPEAIHDVVERDVLVVTLFGFGRG